MTAGYCRLVEMRSRDAQGCNAPSIKMEPQLPSFNPAASLIDTRYPGPKVPPIAVVCSLLLPLLDP